MFLRNYSFRFGVAILFIVSLSGCFVSSPYHGQVFTSRTDPIPFQIWSERYSGMYVECHKALRGEPFQQNGDSSWRRVPVNGHPLESIGPLRDSKGNRINSFSNNLFLQDECWQRSGSGTSRRYQSAVRVVQFDRISLVFDKPGLACAFRAIGITGLWDGFLNEGCFVTHDDSSSPLPFLIVESLR